MQSTASVIFHVHVAIAACVIATVARYGRVGAVVFRTAVQLIELNDILFRESSSSADQIFVVAVLRHHGYFTVPKSGFVIMHY